MLLYGGHDLVAIAVQKYSSTHATLSFRALPSFEEVGSMTLPESMTHMASAPGASGVLVATGSHLYLITVTRLGVGVIGGGSSNSSSSNSSMNSSSSGALIVLDESDEE